MWSVKYLFFVLLLLSLNSFSQDLNARVELLYPSIQAANKNTFNALEKAIKDFLNERKWTDDVIQPQERIECNFIITITAWDGTNFTASAQVQSSRPIYGTTYNSLLLNTTDANFDFTYLEGQALDFSEQNYGNNLSSLLAFYAFMIVGIDYDSYSKMGGTPHYYRAQNVVNSAQNATNKGWKATESFKNRYWLSQNVLDNDYNPIRESIYTYHRLGLDVMSTNATQGIDAILATLPQLRKVDRLKQGNLLSQLFIAAKVDEIVNVLSKAGIQERMDAYSILSQIDPSNNFKYEALKK